MFSALFHNMTEGEKNDAIESIIQHATPRQDFFLMLNLAVMMAVFGVLLNSIVILIGSMLLAPLLYPLLSLALGIIVGDERLIGRSLYTLFRSVLYALLIGVVVGFLFSSHEKTLVTSLGSFSGQSSLMYVIVAAIAGFAAAFAMSKQHLNESLPGVAIAVALVPPLAVAGVGLSLLDWEVFSSALLLFVANVIGIVFSAMIVFSLLRFGVKRKVTEDAIREENKIIKKEKEEKKE